MREYAATESKDRACRRRLTNFGEDHGNVSGDRGAFPVRDRDRHERVRVAVGKRTQHGRVENREDRRDRADPEPERQDGDGGEARVPGEPAEGVAGVLGESAHQLTR